MAAMAHADINPLIGDEMDRTEAGGSTLSWENISFSVRGREEPILKPLSGEVQTGARSSDWASTHPLVRRHA